MKVYNKGTRPIVWYRSRKGVKAIHPRKFDIFGKTQAEEIIKKFDDAVPEKEWNEILIKRIKDTAEKSKKADK